MSADAKSMPRNADRVRDDRDRAEMWFSRHLWDVSGVNVQAGVTMPSERAANIRRVLVEKGLADKVMGKFNGRPETYAQFVKRALGIEVEKPPQETLF